MRPLKNYYTITGVCFIIQFMVLALPAGGQTNTVFDSTLHAIQAINNDNARTTALLSYEKKINRSEPLHALAIDSILLLEAKRAHNKTAEMKSLYRISLEYNMMNNYSASINYSFQALKLAEQLNDYNTQGEIFLSQSNIYAAINDSAHERASIQKALDISVAHKDSSIEEQSLNELGIFYDKQGQHKKAIEYFQASITISAASNDKFALTNTYINMAIAFKGDKQYKKAEDTYNQGLIAADSLKNDYIKTAIFDNMAYLEFEMGEYQQSEKNALLAINMSFEVEAKEIRMDAYALLEKLYEKEKRYPEAINYFGRLAALKDSLLNEENLAQINEMNQKYQADIKDHQILVQQAQLTVQHKLNLLLGGGGIAILLIATFIYFNQRKTARLNRVVSLQRDKLEKQSTTLSVMMKELHHRVKNNLQIVSSLLNLQSLRLTDEEAINAVQESKQRVQAMSLIHQRLYKTEDISRINMKAYIKELSDFLAVSYGYHPENFTLVLDVEEEWVDIDKALPLGLILNELITNAFKYAFKNIDNPSLHIGFAHTSEGVTLSVKDNGNGIKPGQWDGKQNTSFGRQLVKALCSQLRAKEKLETGNGTSFIFTIPEAA